MPPSKISDYAICGNIIASERGITLSDRGRQMQHVAKSEITGIELRHGCSANRPMLEFILGLILSVIGALGVYYLCQDLKGLRYDMVLLVLGLFGLSMIYDVFKKRYLLAILANGSIIRIPFAGKTDIAVIRVFCEEAGRRWGYAIAAKI